MKGILGAISGDVIGSVYENRPIKTKEFELFSHYSIFTDDTVMTLAIAEWLLEDKTSKDVL
ncbi:MAG: ADP-ribosylglycohydrolase family protein, partial [Methanobrevibacter sp.]|nr:ADP-ribosylglycohydrolase family protein [Methanobrevibacter sp.]